MNASLHRRISSMAPRRGTGGPMAVLAGFTPHSVRLRLAERIAASGSDADPIRLAGTKVLLGVAGLLFGIVAASGSQRYVSAAVLAAGGWRWPEARLARVQEARRRRVLSALPDTLDLLAACTLAGASVVRALALASESDDGPLGIAFRAAGDALERGATRQNAYRSIAQSAGTPEVRSVMTTLRRAEILGLPVAQTLSDLAHEMRERRRARAEEEARGAPIKVLFPIVTCFLPAFALLTIAPIVIVALRGFRFQ